MILFRDFFRNAPVPATYRRRNAAHTMIHFRAVGERGSVNFSLFYFGPEQCLEVPPFVGCEPSVDKLSPWSPVSQLLLRSAD